MSLIVMAGLVPAHPDRKSAGVLRIGITGTRPVMTWLSLSLEMNRRADIEAVLRHLAPRIPRHEFGAVVDHALDSPGLRTAVPETAVWLSLVAYVRHVMTDYDAMLAEGYDADSARHFVLGESNAILQEWGVRRRIGDE